MNRSHLESYGGYESPQIRRDRFLFFLIIASIAHLFIILNTTHITNAPQHYPPMEIIFSEEKYKEIKQERATDSNARETNNNSSESTPRTALRDPGKIKLDED